MRIALDLQACQTSGSRNRGIGRYSMSLAQEMARQANGHEIIIVLNNRFPDTIEPIRQAFSGLVRQENMVTFDVPGPLVKHDPASAWRCQAAERIREIFLAGLSPDIVHVSSLFEGSGDDAVPEIRHFDHRFETAVTLYDLIPLVYKETYLTEPISRGIYYRKLQEMKNAELLLSISDHSRREAIAMLQLTADQVVNISSAADAMFRLRTFSDDEANGIKRRYGLTKPFLMYTGGIDYRKNIEGLIEAFSLLPDTLKTRYQLAIVCTMQETDLRRLQALVKRFGLVKNEVVFTGFVSDDDLVALYNLTALFVFPSLHEGFGLPVLEAMSCGAPVVGSNTSSIPEVIGRDDVLFDPKDVRAIATKIHGVLTDTGFQAALREHGFKQIHQFSWKASAKRALEAFQHLHEVKQERRCIATTGTRQRPRLAYISPLPPEKSGIADYSAELLPELARHYSIDVIVAQESVSDAWVTANFPVRSVAWFETHADEYERIVYQFGNSTLHEHMFELLMRHPGIVVLHDFFLSGVPDNLDFTGRVPDAFARALYESHGYGALFDEKRTGRLESIRKYPCNKPILDQAMGIVVHSRFSMQLADAWYGNGSAKDWRYVPLPKATPSAIDRQAARKRLGLKETDFLVCSFGMLASTKLNDRLLRAWLDSRLASEDRCHLVFVGENDAAKYGETLANNIRNSSCHERIKITGFVSQEWYRTYLAAADIAVQLRSHSRGETSASILDCLAYGLPTIVNANGSAAELPGEMLIKLQDQFPQTELKAAIERLWKDADLREHLSRQAAQYVRSVHHPALAGARYREAIEHFSTNGPGADYRRLIRSLTDMDAPMQATEQDLHLTAASIASNQPRKTPRQLLVDVSALVRADTQGQGSAHLFSRKTLIALLNTPLSEYRVEPVYDAGGYYAYARDFTLRLLGIPALKLQDAPAEIAAGDRFLGIDLSWDENNQPQCKPIGLKKYGSREFIIGFDLPGPKACSQDAQAHLLPWLQTIAGDLGELVCISRTVIDGLSGDSTLFPSAQVRQAARKHLGLKDTDILICSFGMPGANRLDDRLLDAWLKSPFARDKRYRLFFIGENDHGAYGETLANAIAQSGCDGRVKVTGAVSREMYHAYLASADMAVQLQASSKAADASAAMLDCLTYGISMIINTNGAGAQLLGEALGKLQDGFSQAELDETAAAVSNTTNTTNTTSSRVAEIVVISEIVRTPNMCVP